MAQEKLHGEIDGLQISAPTARQTTDTTNSKESKADLMYITGVMVILNAIPVGIACTFSAHHHDKDWHWAIITGSAMTVAMGFTGGLLFCIANIILNRRLKMKKEKL